MVAFSLHLEPWSAVRRSIGTHKHWHAQALIDPYRGGAATRSEIRNSKSKQIQNLKLKGTKQRLQHLGVLDYRHRAVYPKLQIEDLAARFWTPCSPRRIKSVEK
jgi:hypothetical protein